MERAITGSGPGLERTLKYALEVSQKLVISREFREQVGDLAHCFKNWFIELLLRSRSWSSISREFREAVRFCSITVDCAGGQPGAGASAGSSESRCGDMLSFLGVKV